MRTLTDGQKVYLNNIIKKRRVFRSSDLKLEEWEALEAMNDTEVLHMEVDRYIRANC